jgi:hypothetical protein
VLKAYTGTPAKLIAKWDVKTYTVAFYNNYAANDNTTLLTKTATAGSFVDLPAIPGRSGYAAKGWYKARSGDTKLTGKQTITGDTNFYIQWVYYGSTSSITANATGGSTTYVSTTAGFDEVHTFTGDGTFEFTARPASLYGRVLVVGGGGKGGKGASADRGGGGGAGGVQYAGYVAMPAASSSVTVTVGAGAEEYSPGGHGKSGGDSYFGDIRAAGGGGGGEGGVNDSNYGRGSVGGSGGGSGAGGGNNTWSGGSFSSVAYTSSGYERHGNAGGWSGGNKGGGGGGAGGPGSDEGEGGKGKLFDISGSDYTYARGGDPGQSSTVNHNYGDGGKGGNTGDSGDSGNSGIVIVRFPYTYMGN